MVSIRESEHFKIFQMRAQVTTGTYIRSALASCKIRLTTPETHLFSVCIFFRSLAHEMGQMVGLGAVAFDIYRTQVGNYSINEAIRLLDVDQKTTTTEEAHNGQGIHFSFQVHCKSQMGQLEKKTFFS